MDRVTRPERYSGIAKESFAPEVVRILSAPVDESDIEIRPDGLIYLPEIKYRRTLNAAIGPGGWALLPVSDAQQFWNRKNATCLLAREYALYCYGRFVSQAVGEHLMTGYYDNSGYGTAVESARSNALMRCCKDLGVASELWDLEFILSWKDKNAVDVWCEHSRTKAKKKLWKKKNRTSSESFTYPWTEIGS